MNNVFSDLRSTLGEMKKKYKLGSRILKDPDHLATREKARKAGGQAPSRTEIINYLLGRFDNRQTKYLEIGVYNPSLNFVHIKAAEKYSVDPGVEFKANPVDFKITSDEFFTRLRSGAVLYSGIRFDVVFIDGLHLADQVEKDILNALDFLSDDGFIVLHDCNPPSEWHTREKMRYRLSPAGRAWNGTTWKAFYKQRFNKNVSCACIDTDWGIGIITKDKAFESLEHNTNPFFEFYILDANRKLFLNLMSFEEYKKHLAEQARTKQQSLATG